VRREVTDLTLQILAHTPVCATKRENALKMPDCGHIPDILQKKDQMSIVNSVFFFLKQLT